MPRTEPTVDLQFCETHVIIKAKLLNGETIRLGSAKLANVPEPDGNQYAYEAKIIKDSEVRQTTTQGANQASIDAENVDKELGLSINDVNTVLTGASVFCSKVFAPILSHDLNTFLPTFWYDGVDIKDVAPNTNVATWPDKSINGRNTTGNGLLKWKQINGYNAVQFDASRTMTIPGSFSVAQVFAVFRSPQPQFSASGSLLSTSPDAFFVLGGTSEFGGVVPLAVRDNGNVLGNPFNLGNLTTTHIVNIQTANPSVARSYQINSPNGPSFYLSELVGFPAVLNTQQEQEVEYILARKYGVELPYNLVRPWQPKVLLTGIISQAEADENTVSIKIVSDIAPNVAFMTNRPVTDHCSLVYKGNRCGYVGPLATCNKLYESDGGCSGRQNQHRFAGIVDKGELVAPIPGDVDTTIGYGNRFWDGEHFPTAERNREFIS